MTSLSTPAMMNITNNNGYPNTTNYSIFTVTFDNSSKIDHIVAEYTHYANILRVFFAIINLIAGSIGNTLTFFVMRQKSMRHTSAGAYFTVLALADSAFMISGEGGFLVKYLLGTKLIFLKHGYIPCNLMYFLHFTAGDYAIWMICAVTVDRFVAVVKPLRAKKYCKVKQARIVCISLLIVLCLKNVHMFWTRAMRWVVIETKHGHSTINGNCEYPVANFNSSQIFEERVRPWIAYTFLAIIPTAIIIAHNIIIIRALHKMEHMRKGNKHLDFDNNQECKLPKSPATKYLRQMTWMFLGVSFVFLTLVPIGYLSIFIYIPDLTNKTFFSVIQAVMISMVYANNASNFYVYCLTGRRFKKEVKALLCSPVPKYNKTDSTLGSSNQQN